MYNIEYCTEYNVTVYLCRSTSMYDARVYDVTIMEKSNYFAMSRIFSIFIFSFKEKLNNGKMIMT